MRLNSPQIILITKLVKKLLDHIRDFGEIENLQVSSKGLEILSLQLTKGLKKY